MNIQSITASRKIAWTIFFMLFAILNNAQSVKSDVSKKIDNIKGSAEKITIIADGEEYMFSGEEAEQLFENMKSMKRKNFAVKMLEPKTDDDSNVWVMRSGDDDDIFVMFNDIEDGGNIKKEIKIEIDDGEKRIEVTTTKDGEESTEVYEGEEAEQYLKKMGKDNQHGFKFLTSDGKMIIIEKDNLSNDDREDLIEVLIDKDGKKKKTKKIIIKKMKDGDENKKDDD